MKEGGRCAAAGCGRAARGEGGRCAAGGCGRAARGEGGRCTANTALDDGWSDGGGGPAWDGAERLGRELPYVAAYGDGTGYSKPGRWVVGGKWPNAGW